MLHRPETRFMPEIKHSFDEGELVGGNYRILSVAGSGGMGVVYRALDLRLERVVALKFLPSELNASQRDRDRFLREARTASSLDHPNIGVIHGVEDYGLVTQHGSVARGCCAFRPANPRCSCQVLPKCIFLTTGNLHAKIPAGNLMQS